MIYPSYNSYLDLMDLAVHCQVFITTGNGYPPPIIDFLILINVFVINMKSLTPMSLSWKMYSDLLYLVSSDMNDTLALLLSFAA